MRQVHSQWNAATFDGTYTDAKHQSEEFNNYKLGEKRRYVAEKTDLESLLGNIQTKVKTYGLRSYTPPAGLSLTDLDAAWRTLCKDEAQRSKAINAKIGGYIFLSISLTVVSKKVYDGHLQKKQTNSPYYSIQFPSQLLNSRAH
jgi:hypothetical protein